MNKKKKSLESEQAEAARRVRENLLGYTQSEWYESVLSHGTSGDQVHSILRDWQHRNELIDEGLNGLLLDLYDLTIANAPLSAGDQREFAADVAKHIGAMRKLVGVVTKQITTAKRQSSRDKA